MEAAKWKEGTWDRELGKWEAGNWRQQLETGNWGQGTGTENLDRELVRAVHHMLYHEESLLALMNSNVAVLPRSPIGWRLEELGVSSNNKRRCMEVSTYCSWRSASSEIHLQALISEAAWRSCRQLQIVTCQTQSSAYCMAPFAGAKFYEWWLPPVASISALKCSKSVAP